MPQGASRLEIGLLYVAGVIQGLALVTFPAASAIFTVRPTGSRLPISEDATKTAAST